MAAVTKATPEAPYLLVYQRSSRTGRITIIRRAFATNDDALAAAEQVHPFHGDPWVMPQLAAEVIERTDRGRMIYNQGIWADGVCNKYAVIFRLLRQGEERD